MNQDTTDALIEEAVLKLIREGQSREYISGYLAGISWGLDFVNSAYKLMFNKKRLIEEEHAERTT